MGLFSKIVDDCSQIRLEYEQKRIIFNNCEKNITYRNLTSPTNAREKYPKDYFVEKSVELNDEQYQWCKEVINSSLKQLSFDTQLPLRPFGAPSPEMLIRVDIDGKYFYYTSEYQTKGKAVRQGDSAKDNFLIIFNLLSSFCDFVKWEMEPVHIKEQEVEDERYFEETLWLCIKCHAGNLMQDSYCKKCGEYRGW